MKTKFQIYCVAITAWFMFGTGVNASSAQSEDSMRVTTPFDSLTIDHIKATGDIKTGMLEIEMIFHNDYIATADISLSLGGFADFGFTIESGKKYKVFTNSHLIGTHDINKGYLNIPFVQFGDKKFDWVTMIQQKNVSHGEERQLIIHVNHFDKNARMIKGFHVRCILFLNLSFVGDKSYKVENLPVEWK